MSIVFGKKNIKKKSELRIKMKEFFGIDDFNVAHVICCLARLFSGKWKKLKNEGNQLARFSFWLLINVYRIQGLDLSY